MSDVLKIDVAPDLWDIVHAILKKHVPQHTVWVFGSRATGKAKKYSDLDLAIISDKPLSLGLGADLKHDFAESDLPWRVDIVDWATTPAYFREIIEAEKIVVQEHKKGIIP